MTQSVTQSAEGRDPKDRQGREVTDKFPRLLDGSVVEFRIN